MTITGSHLPFHRNDDQSSSSAPCSRTERTSVQRSIRIKIFSATWYRDSGALIRASRLPEHPCIQLRRCPHRGLPQRRIKETSDDHRGIRRSDGSDLPGNNVLKAALRDRCGRRAPHGIRYLPDRLCAGGGKEEKVRDELLNIITSSLCRTVFTTVLFFAVFSNFYIHRSPSPPAFFECATAKTAVLFTCHISMQKNNCLYLFILLSLSISCRKIHYIPVRRPVRPGRKVFSRDPDDPFKGLRKEKIPAT